MEIKVDPRAEGLIFDLDGTLSNSLPVHVATWKAVGEKYGFPFDDSIIHDMTGRPTLEFAQQLVNEHNLDAKAEDLVKMKQQLFWDSIHLVVPVKEVESIARAYFGKLPMAVGTGASRHSAELQLSTMKLDQIINAVVSADDVDKHKPEPDTFLKCAEMMGVEPSKCMVFEDGNLGIEAAKRAGMIVVDVRDYIDYGTWEISL